MTATKIIIEALLSGQPLLLAPETVYQAIKELAEDQATTFGLARSVADWAENAQDRCKVLEGRVKALEELADPAPAPDLDALLEKYSLLLAGLFPLTRPAEFRDALRAFAAELGVK